MSRKPKRSPLASSISPNSDSQSVASSSCSSGSDLGDDDDDAEHLDDLALIGFGEQGDNVSGSGSGGGDLTTLARRSSAEERMRLLVQDDDQEDEAGAQMVGVGLAEENDQEAMASGRDRERLKEKAFYGSLNIQSGARDQSAEDDGGKQDKVGGGNSIFTSVLLAIAATLGVGVLTLPYRLV